MAQLTIYIHIKIIKKFMTIFQLSAAKFVITFFTINVSLKQLNICDSAQQPVIVRNKIYNIDTMLTVNLILCLHYAAHDMLC